jgi:hypothetical protein
MNDELYQRFVGAIEELEALYRNQDLDIEERKFQLSVRKELSKTLKLYTAAIELGHDGAAVENDELRAVREHLEPLGLAEGVVSVSELARLAALRILDK